MNKLLVASVALCAFAALTIVSQPVWAGMENCFVVRATADARNQQISTDRAQRRLQEYIARNLSSLTGKHISSVTTNCIRNACESTAIVCHH